MDDAPALDVIELAGTPRHMGEAFGEVCRTQAHELYERRLHAAIAYARVHAQREFDDQRVLELARQCLPISERYDPVGFEEFLGIARGANLAAEQLFVTQGLTDLRDVLAFSDVADPAAAMVPEDPDAEGCSAFIVAPDRARDGHLLAGQTWDLATDNMPYVRLVHRRPDDAPETVSLTLTGCLTLIGLNSEGVAVGNTNLRTRDARLGLQYLSILHRALRCRTLDEAVPTIADAPRSAAHFYYLAEAGRAVGLECSAARCERFDVDRGVFVHCNHALTDTIAAIEAPIASDSTAFRQRQLSDLLESHKASIDVKDVTAAMSDRTGGDQAVCRYRTGPFDISTNAAVVMSPADGEMHACRAQPDRGQWRTWRLN